ncbi:unnamed protein product [Rhizopus microsporus]
MLFPSTVRYPLRAVWDVKGYPTETLLWPAKNNTNKTVLFFIPGNPGLVEYYAPFLRTFTKTCNHHFLKSLEYHIKGIQSTIMQIRLEIRPCTLLKIKYNTKSTV